MRSTGSFMGTGASYTATIRAAAREAAREVEVEESPTERAGTLPLRLRRACRTAIGRRPVREYKGVQVGVTSLLGEYDGACAK